MASVRGGCAAEVGASNAWRLPQCYFFFLIITLTVTSFRLEGVGGIYPAVLIRSLGVHLTDVAMG
jgi:hypothetical protein